MHTTAIKVFFGTLLMLVPVRVSAEPNTQTVRSLSDTQQGDRNIVQPLVWKLPASLTIEFEEQYKVREFGSSDFARTSAAFQAGTISWRGKTKLGLMKLDGNFDSSAHLTKGKGFLSTPTIFGSVNLAIDLNDRVQPIKTVTGWQTSTPVGSLAVEGNFSPEIAFTGGNAAWNAKTKIGTVTIKGNFDRDINFTGANAAWNAKSKIATFGVRGNFDRDTNFTGGNVQITSKAIVGSFKADLKIDRESQFNGANAAWDTNLLFGSNVGVSGNFDRTNTFTGGSIRLDAKSIVGTLGVKANLDRDTNFISGSAFWKTKTKLGSINLDADLKKDGNFSSKLGMEFPF